MPDHYGETSWSEKTRRERVILVAAILLGFSLFAGAILWVAL